jgi:hypothetical protein
MAMTPEGRVKHAVKQELKRRGIWYFMPVSNGMGQVGIPDFICCWEGKFLAIETKAPGKRTQTTANQDRIIAEIKDHWGRAVVVDDVSKLIDYLEDFYEQGRG